MRIGTVIGTGTVFRTGTVKRTGTVNRMSKVIGTVIRTGTVIGTVKRTGTVIWTGTVMERKWNGNGTVREQERERNGERYKNERRTVCMISKFEIELFWTYHMKKYNLQIKFKLKNTRISPLRFSNLFSFLILLSLFKINVYVNSISPLI